MHEMTGLLVKEGTLNADFESGSSGLGTPAQGSEQGREHLMH